MAESSSSTAYSQEVRFAVVMYGGVSLAIYINGVAQELLRLVRSTAKPNPAKPLSGSELIYRKVSYLLANEQSGIKDAQDAAPNSLPPTRFSIDIISGSSAGGINGIFLAKSLANGQNMDRLKELWIQEGDIETLINDKRSIEKPLKLQSPPTSLLNSERMYFELLKAFDEMDEEVPRKEDDESPLVDELDLFITSTDLEGVVLPISLSDRLVYEKRHRNVMRFVYSERKVSGDDTRNDFYAKFNPFLAYAARCTSSFPFAFEPMALSDIDKLLRRIPKYAGNAEYMSDSKEWSRFYRVYSDPRGASPVPFPDRPFGDGGYLDNKPFTYATETLMNRTASVPVDRKLIYIEPSPEHPEDDVELGIKPDAIANVMLAVSTLPRHETIREDLERVNERNRLIDRVNNVTSGVERDEDQVKNIAPDLYTDATDRWKDFGALATPYIEGELWSEQQLTDAQQGKLDLTDAIKRKGRSYAAYLRLRISAVTDDLAKLITRLAGFDETSEYAIIVRSMVRAWRVQKYIEYRETSEDPRPTVNQFLYEFDLAYPIRRANYLRAKVDALYRLEREAMTVINIEARKFEVNFGDPKFEPRLREAFSKQVLDYKSDLNEIFINLRKAVRSLRSRTSVKETNEPAKVEIPLSKQVEALMAQISAAVRPLQPNKNSRSLVIDYFLGKREVKLDDVNERSYKAASPEEQCVVRAQDFLKDQPALIQLIQGVADTLKLAVVDVKGGTESRIIDLFTATSTRALDPDPQIDTIKWIAKYCIGHYYHNYEDYDLLSYPILYNTDVGEADNVDIIRISPEDATQLINERKTGCQKLAGVALGNFGAFLQKSWRENDILWGRLDGAERIITALLPNHPLMKQLIGEAQAAIICETIAVMGEEERHELLAESVMRTRTRKAEPQHLDLLVANLRKYCKSEPGLKKSLDSLIKTRNLRQFYLKNFRIRSKVDPENSLRSAARATNVVGKILESLSSKNNVNTKYALWIARLGQIFWAIVEVAVPRSFPNLIFRHWLKLIYFLEVLLIIGSTLLTQPQMQQFGVTAFGITAGFHLAVVVIADLLASRYFLLNVLKTILIITVALIFAVGVTTIAGLFGVESAWNTLIQVQHRIVTPTPFGFNVRTFYLYGVPTTVVVMFLVAIRRDFKLSRNRTNRKKRSTTKRIAKS